MPDTREPLPGEMCACGRTATIVLIRDLGDVPTCRGPADYQHAVEEIHRAAREAVRRVMDGDQ